MFKGDPLYDEIKSELAPFITGVIIADKTTRTYNQFRKNFREWNQRFHKTLELSETVESMQQPQTYLMRQISACKDSTDKAEKLTIVAVMNLFRYLALVESIGVSILDILVLLLVANDHDFHVERAHDLPHIVHATDFRDLDNCNLADKIAYLERNGLKKTSSFINRKLRNDIAHIDFHISKEGKTSTKSYSRGVNTNQEINMFNRVFMMITLVLSDSGIYKVYSESQKN
jgi:hypothetical protein